MPTLVEAAVVYLGVYSVFQPGIVIGEFGFLFLDVIHQQSQPAEVGHLVVA